MGVVGIMLYVIGMPAFVIFFLAAFSFFLWKIFATGSASETRRIFEFYLTANEILRHDERRWFGFEVIDTIGRGEKIIQSMSTPPPLLRFALGALYQKLGDEVSAEKHLASVLDSGSTTESAIVYPSNDLRDYVRVLRKIERDPAEAPQTSAAVRSLERLRKNKGRTMLEQARDEIGSGRTKVDETAGEKDPQYLSFRDDEYDPEAAGDSDGSAGDTTRKASVISDRSEFGPTRRAGVEKGEKFPVRKPISEVLQDIYDDKVQ